MRKLIHKTLSQCKRAEQSFRNALQRVHQASTRSIHRQSLRSKLVLLLAAIFFMLLLIDNLVRNQVIKPELERLEKLSARRDAERVIATLNREAEHLAELADSYAGRMFETDRIKSSLSQNKPDGGWHLKKTDWVAELARDGTWTWIESGSNSQKASLYGARQNLRGLAQSCQLSSRPTTSGMARLGSHHFIFFTIIALDAPKTETGVPPRCLVFVRRMDDELTARLSEQLQVNFRLQSASQSTTETIVTLNHADQQTLIAKAGLPGIDRQRIADVIITIHRNITIASNQAINLARLSFILGSICVLLTLLLMLHHVVIKPLRVIREHSNLIAREGFRAEPLKLQRDDEIGQVVTAFDKMLRHLRDAQAKLTQTSQAAGRSQVATTVIHNIGNVLTNVNSLLYTATSGIEGLRIGPLDKLARRLRTDQGNQLLLEATPDYLEGLAGSLKSDQESIHDLLSTLQENVRHIHDVIRDQQRHADPKVSYSLICIKDLLEEAVLCCRGTLSDDMTYIEYSGDLSQQVYSDRSLLLQAMINVIGNAGHAMSENEDRARVLCISVQTLDQFVEIMVQDNGCGISQEVLEKIFDSHFTTKDSGTGLGLHFCAATLKRLRGSIVAKSEGPGQGATFVISLPRHASFVPALTNNAESHSAKSFSGVS